MLRKRYNLPLNDQNIVNMSKSQWSTFINESIKSYAFDSLAVQCQLGSKTKHLHYSKLELAPYLTNCDSQIARNMQVLGLNAQPSQARAVLRPRACIS